jgi:addiction module HigA family antidote
MYKAKLLPIHPGEILWEEFLAPMGISQYKLAHDMDVPETRINEIVKGKRSITADTAMRLALYFDNNAEFWMNLQSSYDLKIARQKYSKTIKARVKPLSLKKAKAA